MANHDADWDAAAEQLYDEMMSRTWALHGVLRSESTDVTRLDVCTRLADVALRRVDDTSHRGRQRRRPRCLAVADGGATRCGPPLVVDTARTARWHQTASQDRHDA